MPTKPNVRCPVPLRGSFGELALGLMLMCGVSQVAFAQCGGLLTPCVPSPGQGGFPPTPTVTTLATAASAIAIAPMPAIAEARSSVIASDASKLDQLQTRLRQIDQDMAEISWE